ncbi:MAG: HAD-IIIA family hydrolase [Paludibacteraceae bacterium]|nr:HAD-IIIA family hydrolase [Paludibacteraceae bacterium]
MENFKSQFSNLKSSVKLFLTDVDGCLTEGGMYYTAEGEVMKRFCVYDGMGMVCLQQAGIPCGILTSENSMVVKARAEKLQLRYLYLGVGSKVNPKAKSKLEAAKEICEELGIGLESVCFVGDDINDVELLSAVGYPCCPPNARPEVLAVPGIRVLQTPGGQGAIREIADAILNNRTND